VTKSQAGFRAGYSTQDNIFILYSLITLYLSKNSICGSSCCDSAKITVSSA
jgi:hypothetical protein